MIRAMYSVAVFVSDIDRAVAFYRDDLELPLTKHGSFGAEFLEQEPHLGVHPAVHPDAKTMVRWGTLWAVNKTGNAVP